MNKNTKMPMNHFILLFRYDAKTNNMKMMRVCFISVITKIAVSLICRTETKCFLFFFSVLLVIFPGIDATDRQNVDISAFSDLKVTRTDAFIFDLSYFEF